MIVPFLCFHGQTQEAVRYYQTIFKFEEPRFLLFNQVPQRGFDVPDVLLGGVMFTEFNIDGTQVMACDHYPGLGSQPGQTISLNIISSDRSKMVKAFEALLKDGQLGLPLQETLWAPLYGSLVDKYGVVWQFSLNA